MLARNAAALADTHPKNRAFCGLGRKCRMCEGCEGVFLSALSYNSQEKKSREKHPEEGLYAPSCPRCSGTKAPARKNAPAMSRQNPAPAPPYVHAHVTRGLRPPCRQATPTPPTPRARHTDAPLTRRARPTRTPREPHECRTLAPLMRRASAGLLTHIACQSHGHPPTLRPLRGARTSLGLRRASPHKCRGSTPAAASGGLSQLSTQGPLVACG